MNWFLRVSTLLLLVCDHPLALAASAVDLAVSGSITPDACYVVLSDGGTVDHGKIAAGSLKPDEFTVLPTRVLELGIHCSRPMLFALVGIDNRADSSLAPDFFYGLGTNVHAPDERLGSVSLSYRDPIGDNQPMQALGSSDSGETWVAQTNAYPRQYMGFALPGEGQPDFIRQFTTQLRIDTAINLSRALTLNQEVPLDGSIVLDLRYL
ncbi:DUF1120 domain-containing protein [Pseudomonas kitaguniensis]|uniref:DUF1120 domain-containing protein n=1 Tax=Pseudomonas kitaguniensis TaxID=2607908 RepID=UPI003B9E71B3